MFVPLVESGWFDDPITDQVVERYLAPFKDKVDTLVLGCTHYPLLSGSIQKEMGSEVKLINVSEEAVKEMKAFLEGHEMAADPAMAEAKTYDFYASDSIESFRDFCETVLGERHLKVQQVNIEQYPSKGDTV